MANKLSRDKKRMIISALVEGASVRSVERITGCHRDTICRLLVRVRISVMPIGCFGHRDHSFRVIAIRASERSDVVLGC